jgi:hypothetical protein
MAAWQGSKNKRFACVSGSHRQEFNTVNVMHAKLGQMNEQKNN